MLKESEIAKLFETTRQAINYKKQKNKNQYDIIRLGSICKKHDISEEDLEKAIKILKICEERNNEEWTNTKCKT